ncbi:MAG: VWA-like domain-containing protein [Raoultibacter sp.]
MNDRNSQMHDLALEILSMTRGRLLVNFRFLDMALFQVKDTPSLVYPWAVDGVHLFYSDAFVLQCYQAGKNEVMRSLFHVLLHCVFQHMFVSYDVDCTLWDLCCNMAVEHQILSLNHIALYVEGDDVRRAALKKLQGMQPQMTAERLYYHFLKNPPNEKELTHYQQLFARDTHALWYLPNPSAQAQAQQNDEGQPKAQDGSQGAQALTAEQAAKAQAQWEKTSARMQTDLESFAQQQGTDPGNMLQALHELHREKYDYASFLKKFAARNEVMQIDPDEFDYVFYTYGLNLYKDMPIIEPLEYCEALRIRDLVIAIDTSGSTSGELVQTFLQKTYNILKQEETFRQRFVLHILQCDTEIQDDAVVTTQEEFDTYIAQMTIKGLGGTDFRPVFQRVDKLIEQKAFRNLKGLLYFTDGYGTFPEKKPPYEAAFVFVDDDATDVDVPPWAIKLVLRSDEIVDE